jgi:hypothetical protein
MKAFLQSIPSSISNIKFQLINLEQKKIVVVRNTSFSMALDIMFKLSIYFFSSFSFIYAEDSRLIVLVPITTDYSFLNKNLHINHEMIFLFRC